MTKPDGTVATQPGTSTRDDLEPDGGTYSFTVTAVSGDLEDRAARLRVTAL